MATSIMASGDVGGEAGKGMAPEEARALYDDWGDGYTTSVESWGYTMPHEIAAALASLADDAPSFSGKILDAGVLAEFVRVTKPGGHICYNIRTDHKLAWLETEKAMVANGSWQLLTETEPRPYLPNNPDYADKVLTVISCYRKTA